MEEEGSNSMYWGDGGGGVAEEDECGRSRAGHACELFPPKEAP